MGEKIKENNTLSADHEYSPDLCSCSPVDPSSILKCRYCGYISKNLVEERRKKNLVSHIRNNRYERYYAEHDIETSSETGITKKHIMTYQRSLCLYLTIYHVKNIHEEKATSKCDRCDKQLTS